MCMRVGLNSEEWENLILLLDKIGVSLVFSQKKLKYRKTRVKGQVGRG